MPAISNQHISDTSAKLAYMRRMLPYIPYTTYTTRVSRGLRRCRMIGECRFILHSSLFSAILGRQCLGMAVLCCLPSCPVVVLLPASKPKPWRIPSPSSAYPPLPQISVFLRCPRWDGAKVEQTPFKFLDRLTNFPYPPITSPTHSGWPGHSFFFDKLIEFRMPHAAKLEY